MDPGARRGSLHTLSAHLAEQAPDGAWQPREVFLPKLRGGALLVVLLSRSSGLFTARCSPGVMVPVVMVPGTLLQDMGIFRVLMDSR